MRWAQNFFLKTLRGRLILSVALVHAVLMSLFIIDTSSRQRSIMKERHKLSAIRLSQALSTSAAGWIVSKDYAGIQELIDAEKQYPGLVFAVVTDARGLVVADSKPDNLGRYLIDLPATPQLKVMSKTGSVVDVAMPVFLSKQHVGWVRIGLDLVYTDSVYSSLLDSGLIYAVVAILIGSLLAWFLGFRITRRLYAVQETMDEVRLGKSSARVVIDGSDEAAQLGHEFNRMLDVLEERSKRLKESQHLIEGILNAIPTRIFWKDKDLIYKGCNALFALDAGFTTPEEVIGKDDFQMGWKAQADLYRSDDLSVIANGIPKLNFEEPQSSASEHKALLTSKVPLFDQQGVVVGVLGTYMDVSKLKTIESELRKAHDKLRATLQAIPDLMFEVGLSGEIYDCHTGRYDLLAVPPEEFLGKRFVDLLPPDAAAVCVESIEEAYKNGYSSMKQYSLPLPQGEVWFELSSASLNVTDDSEQRFILISRDVTDQKIAADIIAKNEEMLKTVFDNSTVGIVIFDRKAFLKKSNRIIDELFGLDTETQIDVYNLREDPNYQFGDVWERLDRGEQVCSVIEFDFDNVIYPTVRTGIGYLEVITTPLSESTSNEIGYITHVIDVTERKLADKKIADSEKRYRALFENTGTSMLIIDEDLTVSLSNEEFSRSSGYSREEVDGKMKWTDFVYHEDVSWMYEQHKLRRTHPELALQTYEFRYKTKSGSIRYALMNIGMMPDNKKSLASMIDITERKEAELQLVIAKQKAEESDLLKSAFLANMSHEIRTPMNGILGFSELLKNDKLSKEDRHKYISIIEKSGERMLSVINDILSISRVEAGQVDISLSEININEQIEYLCTFFKPEAQIKGLKLIWHKKSSSQMMPIVTDREKLYAILSNLIKNAIKYTDEGEIEVGYERIANEIQFFVKDTGIGVPEDRQAAIFDRFVQADIRDKRALQGTGLGLSIAQAYVAMLGGRIWVESKVDVGSTFFFTIPIEANRWKLHGDTTLITGKKVKGAIMKLKILIAEDDEASDLMLTLKLKKLGHEIVHARNGKEAVTMYAENRDIDLILMDIKMPEMDGYEATKMIRKLSDSVVIIAQTAYGLTGEKEKAIELGCNDYIPKPINYSLLMMLMQKHCFSNNSEE